MNDLRLSKLYHLRKPALDVWICVGLFVAVLAVYGQVRSHTFVSFDDPIYVTENPQVRGGLSWDGRGLGHHDVP
jgi:hypothetical protein